MSRRIPQSSITRLIIAQTRERRKVSSEMADESDGKRSVVSGGVGPPLSTRRIAPWIFLALGTAILALHASLFLLDVSPRPRGLVGDEKMYLQKAQKLVAGETLAHDPLWPPLYPRLVAALLTVSDGSLLVVWVAQTALLVALAIVIAALAKAWLGEGPHVLAAAALTLLDPTLGAFAHYLWPELSHVFLLAFAIWILAARRERRAWSIVFGATLGIALLTKSLLTPVVPWLLLLLVWSSPPLEAFKRAAFALLALGLVLLPTLSAAYRDTGRAFVADSSRFNLWLGLTDTGRRDRTDRGVGLELRAFRVGGETHLERNRAIEARIRAFVAERGPGRILLDQLGRQYFRLLSHHSVLTDQLPGGVLAWGGRGYAAGPGAITRGLEMAAVAFHALLLVAFAFALATLPLARQPWWWGVVGFLAYNLALFLLLHVKSRYRIQIEPFLILWVGCALGTWLRRPAVTPSRARLLLGTAGAVLLLFLAFGGDWLES